jgi:SAM-dependent methyltransferase
MNATPSKTAAALRKRANAMQKRIDAKLHPAIADQNPTPRRASIAAGMAQEAEGLQREQAALRALAERHESNELDLWGWNLCKVRFASQVRLILNKYTRITYEDDAKILARAGITTQAALDSARIRLEHLVEQQGTVGLSEEEKAVAAAERALVGRKIPGFFPTPGDLIDIMLDHVGRVPDSVLEPSAGKGDICEAIRDRWPEANLQACEINHELAELLRLKGFSAVQGDFLSESFHPAEYRVDQFDAIVMNPPFEASEDIDHVRRAYEWLRPGGVLVSIVSEGPFFRQDRASREFRDWLVMAGAEVYKNDEGAFKKAFRSTGVATRIVVIEKEI